MAYFEDISIFFLFNCSILKTMVCLWVDIIVFSGGNNLMLFFLSSVDFCTFAIQVDYAVFRVNIRYIGEINLSSVSALASGLSKFTTDRFCLSLLSRFGRERNSLQ